MKYSVLAIFFVYLCFNSSSVMVVYTDEASVMQESVKNHALIILREKCNVCHATKKRTETFTQKNMDSLAGDIYEQVFVKRKMPKGRKVKLTDSESEKLKVWLSDILDVN